MAKRVQYVVELSFKCSSASQVKSYADSQIVSPGMTNIGR
jgi:hypothetical protein